ncbi:hypothetical protein I307_04820 [Cryptococcus deuterogattii 99/473]|uniref:Uncharacterized protein n=1 Tax=Cryptococcus deuterogattii Ram5 TaxID=1296110 RepID=A0A0D0V588_9TREE|nr:hypothetical protein I313_04001 [Cryptococcus deuterogattii Ram5]KIR71474.1 hypothetical protein I310_04781 [Cryptococcus deuterogattii CA1014]KIR96483.1 hypothetical protein L804_06318 [Cryptococcus deuterogattii 2001/935-1]KIY55881.1 hypothetical protein I307_04820 [Cryptococcus deuterogattii 99/473]
MMGKIKWGSLYLKTEGQTRRLQGARKRKQSLKPRKRWKLRLQGPGRGPLRHQLLPLIKTREVQMSPPRFPKNL